MASPVPPRLIINKIETNKMNIIGDEGQGNAQNNDGILGAYLLRYLYLSGR